MQVSNFAGRFVAPPPDGWVGDAVVTLLLTNYVVYVGFQSW